MANKMHVNTTINGKATAFDCEPRQSLLEVLRDELHLTGTKEGCNNGNCGSCNVLLNGRLVNSCLVLGVEVQDAIPPAWRLLRWSSPWHPAPRSRSDRSRRRRDQSSG